MLSLKLTHYMVWGPLKSKNAGVWEKNLEFQETDSRALNQAWALLSGGPSG